MGSHAIQPLSLGMTLVGLAVLIAVRLIYSRASWHPDDQVRLALRVMGWVLLAVGALALLEMLLGQLFGVLFWIVAILACGNMAHRYQQSEQTALLWMLAVAAERGMPLAEATSIEQTAELIKQAGFVEVEIIPLKTILELDQRFGVAPNHEVQLQYLIRGTNPAG